MISVGARANPTPVEAERGSSPEAVYVRRWARLTRTLGAFACGNWAARAQWLRLGCALQSLEGPGGSVVSPRAREEIVRPRRSSDVVVRPPSTSPFGRQRWAVASFKNVVGH